MPDEVRPGRRSRYRFTQTPQWALLLPELSDAGYRAYSLLLAHVSQERDDALVWPHQRSLAAMLSKRPEALSRVITKELVPLGLVDVEARRYGANRSRRRNVYTVHEEPPEGWQGVASVGEWYAAHRETAGQPGDAKNRVSGDAKNRASGDAKNRAGNYTKGDLHEGEGSRVSAVGQSAGGGARAAGSDSAAGKPAPGKGGSAADTKKSAPKTKTRKLAPPPPPVPGEDDVWAMLDAELLAIGQRRGVRPPTLRKAVRKLLGHGGGADTFALHPRGPEHAAQRLYQGWQQAGGRERATPGYAGPLEPIRRPVGYLVEVLTATPCQEQACERGVLLTTGAECADCGERAAERAAAALRERLTAMMPGLPEPRRVGPRPEPPMRPVGTWVCEGEGCGRKGAGDRPDVPLCSDCLGEIERARREYLALHHGVSARG